MAGSTRPKRSDQRHGHRTKAEQGRADTSARGSATVTWPEPDSEWHPIAQDWFRSLGASGQAQFFEPSDVATARYVAEAMSTNLSQDKFSSMLFTAVMSASADLLATEGSRRKLRIELQKDPVEPDVEQQSAVTSMTERRQRLRKTS